MTVQQNMRVYCDNEKFRVIGTVTLGEVLASDQAHLAIQGAIDACVGTGGKVILEPGTYPLNAPISMGNHITLVGSGRGTRLKISLKNEEGIGIRCHNVRGAAVSDLLIIAANKAPALAGILIDDSQDCKVFQVTVMGMEKYGIYVRSNSILCELRGCVLTGNDSAGIYLEDLECGRYGDFVPNHINNCIIYGGGKGIACSNAIVVNIVGCTVYQSRDIAYHIANTSNSVLISGCRSFQISNHAVLVENSHEVNISSSIFCWHTQSGIVVRDSFWGVISANEIIDSGSHNPGGKNRKTRFSNLKVTPQLFDALRLEGSRGFSVTGNTVFNWSVAPKIRVGIYEDAACRSNTILGNNINYFNQAGIVSKGESSISENNATYAEYSYDNEDNRRWRHTEAHIQSFQTDLTDQLIRDLRDEIQEPDTR